MTVRIEQFDVASDPARLHGCYEIAAAAREEEVPGVPARALAFYRNRWTTGFGEMRRQTWVGSDETGRAIGYYLLILPDKENATITKCDLAITPACRRRGLGRALLEHCVSQAVLAGRERLVGEISEGSPGSAFAAAAGARSGSAAVLRRLDIGAELPDRLASLRTAARPLADGYSLLTWIGPSPPDVLDDQTLLSAAMADAPREAGVDPQVWDAERTREMERVCLSTGQQFYAAAARHEASGRLVAITQVSVEAATPGWGFQMNTAVLAAHRGHRLGLLVKAEMLDLLAAQEPTVRHILTGNAAENEHMIAINEQLGFTVASVRRNWELDLTVR